MIGNGYSLPIYNKYETTKNHVIEFFRWKYAKSDTGLNELEFQMVTEFEFYLKSVEKIGQNTAAKYIQLLKKIVTDCVNKRWIKADPFAGYTPKSLPTTATFLFDYELSALENKTFKMERLELVKNFFVFSCYTGLAYIDIFNLTPNNIAVGIDGEKWIFTGRQKNDNPSHIPLLPAALQIIEKYKDHPVAIYKNKVIPILSNQKTNSYLKEIADLCGIDKNLTCHASIAECL